MDGHRREEAVINKELKFQCGGVVQLVRTLERLPVTQEAAGSSPVAPAKV
jgi:hypothetical protein